MIQTVRQRPLEIFPSDHNSRDSWMFWKNSPSDQSWRNWTTDSSNAFCFSISFWISANSSSSFCHCEQIPVISCRFNSSDWSKSSVADVQSFKPLKWISPWRLTAELCKLERWIITGCIAYRNFGWPKFTIPKQIFYSPGGWLRRDGLVNYLERVWDYQNCKLNRLPRFLRRTN